MDKVLTLFMSFSNSSRAFTFSAYELAASSASFRDALREGKKTGASLLFAIVGVLIVKFVLEGRTSPWFMLSLFEFKLTGWTTPGSALPR